MLGGSWLRAHGSLPRGGPKKRSNGAQNTANKLGDLFFFHISIWFMGVLLIPKWLILIPGWIAILF